LLTTITALIFGILISSYYAVQLAKNSLIKNFLLQAELFAEYLVSPLVFEDKKGAKAVLEKLRVLRNIKEAVLIKSDGKIFVSYNLSNKDFWKTIKIEKNSYKIGRKFLYINKEIFFNDKKLEKYTSLKI